MKTYTHASYGDPEKVVTLKEFPMPAPSGHEVLVKVKASTINDYDWSVTSGEPRSYRLLFGLSKPRKKFQKLGMEVAGTIEQLGDKVTRFQVGDDVYGDTSNHAFGSLGTHLCVNEKALIKKPERMTFEDAAALPHASLLAYQGLLLGKLKDGMNILINGAGGGMGTFALQIAKQYDIKVTGVDSGAKLEMLTNLGFDHVIDYQKEDFTKNGKQYDLILDPRTNRSPFSFLRSLTPNGRYVTIGGNTGALLQTLMVYPLVRLFTGKRVMVLGLEANKHLDKISELYLAGKLKPVIDGPHPFEEVPRLLHYFGGAKHKGKIVIKGAV